MLEDTANTSTSMFASLKYVGDKSTSLITILNSDFEQVAKFINSFCTMIQDKLMIKNDLQLSCPPISTDYNRLSRRQLIDNVQRISSTLSRLTNILDKSPFKKIERGQIVSYALHAYMDVGIKLTKGQANDYIKQLETTMQELSDFKTKYRLNK